MEILFLSTDSWCPVNGASDTVSLLINGEIMVDTGWHPVHNLLREGTAVRDVRTLLLTHLHQDHRIGLPAILFYLLNSFKDAGTLEICGVDGVERIVRMAQDFAGKPTHYPDAPDPRVSVLAPGDRLERAGLTIDTAPSRHAVPGLMYRFTDAEGHVVVYCGDTAPTEETARFARGADVLIHEHSWGPVRPADDPNTCRHSSAEDAARAALEAGVKQLYLVHCHPDAAEESLAHARTIFPDTFRPKQGDRIIL